MAKDSIGLIREAERQAQEAVAKASTEARILVEEAKKRAVQASAEMIASAQQAANEALEVSREEGQKMTESDAIIYQRQCDEVRAQAEKKREAAIELVIDKITQ